MDALTIAFLLVAVPASFALSASAGLGGSLILVPSLTLVLGVKEGVALAALLLAGNNVMKVLAYKRSLPFRHAAPVVVLTAIGASVGASLLVAAPEAVVTAAVIGALAAAFLIEQHTVAALRRATSPALAMGSGLTSGFSGTSGPLKGVAIRGLSLDRLHTVGAASLASLAGDATKAAVFTEVGLLDGASFVILVAAVPLMVVSTLAGRRLNRTIGEYGYRALFWVVMVGYSARLVLA